MTEGYGAVSPPNGGGRGDFSQQKALNKAVCAGFSTLPPAYAGPPSLSRDGLKQSHLQTLIYRAPQTTPAGRLSTDL